jgi:hypothetical protein
MCTRRSPRCRSDRPRPPRPRHCSRRRRRRSMTRRPHQHPGIAVDVRAAATTSTGDQEPRIAGRITAQRRARPRCAQQRRGAAPAAPGATSVGAAARRASAAVERPARSRAAAICTGLPDVDPQLALADRQRRIDDLGTEASAGRGVAGSAGRADSRHVEAADTARYVERVLGPGCGVRAGSGRGRGRVLAGFAAGARGGERRRAQCERGCGDRERRAECVSAPRPAGDGHLEYPPTWAPDSGRGVSGGDYRRRPATHLQLPAAARSGDQSASSAVWERCCQRAAPSRWQKSAAAKRSAASSSSPRARASSPRWWSIGPAKPAW